MAEEESEGSLYAVMRIREVFTHKAGEHRTQRSVFNLVYLSLGSLSVVLAVIVGGLSSSTSEPAITVLALTLAALNALLSFTGMESRVQRHETAFHQYESLTNEIEKAVVTENLRGGEAKAIRDLEKVVFERHDVIAGSEPPISSCCKKPVREMRYRKQKAGYEADDEHDSQELSVAR